MRFSCLTTTLALAALAVVASVHADDNPDNAEGKKFYITEPACNSAKCHVLIRPGSTLHINWLNPINGKVDIQLTPDESSKGLKSYRIASKIAGHNNDDKCDKAGQQSCGMYDWSVPKDLKPGNYTVDIHSLHRKTLYGHSDIVTVTSNKTAVPAKKTNKDKDENTAAHKHRKNETEKAEPKKQHKTHKKHNGTKHHSKSDKNRRMQAALY